MRVYDAKNIKYQDKLAEKRRRFWILKALFFVGLVIAIVGFILYLLFFSGLLDIKEVSINGLDKVSGEEFNNELNERLNSKWLGLLEHQKSVIFFDSDAFKTEILTTFPEIKEISVSKELLHSLNIDITERTTAGIWCFIDDCRYFDREGVTWGQVIRSSGFLILIVEDMKQDTKGIDPEPSRKGSQRVSASYGIDRELLSGIMLISERLKKKDIFISKFVIPGDFIGDFSAFTSSGYELLFSVDSDVRSQLDTLDIFLAEKKDDPDFKPQYIDLRVSRRVYYK